MPDARCNRRGVGPVPNTGACTFPPSCVCLEFAIFLRAMTTPRYTALVQSLPATVPFVGPETQERARGALSPPASVRNESVFGPSPRAVAAMAEALRRVDVWRPGGARPARALAAHHGMPENIVVGEGIDGLLGYLVRLLVAEGDAVVTSDGAYPTFNYHVAGFGGRAAQGALFRRPRGPAGADREGARGGCEAGLLRQSRQPDGQLARRGDGAGDDRRAARGRGAGPRRGLLRHRPRRRDPASRPGPIPASSASAPSPRPTGLAGLRVGYGLARPTSSPPSTASATISASAAWRRPVRWPRWPIRAPDARRGRHRGGARPDRRDRAENGLTPLPSATNFVTIDCGRDGISRARCWPGSWRAASSCACPSRPRRIAASACPADRPRRWTPSPRHSVLRAPSRASTCRCKRSKFEPPFSRPNRSRGGLFLRQRGAT
jgi:histidinol-phosphate aminotransferase